MRLKGVGNYDEQRLYETGRNQTTNGPGSYNYAFLWNRAKGTVWLIALVPIIDRTESIPLSLGLVAQRRAEQNMGLQVR